MSFGAQAFAIGETAQPRLRGRPSRIRYLSMFAYDQRRVILIKRFHQWIEPFSLELLLPGLAGCGEDNEAAIKEQASKAKGTIPGSRTAQAQTQEEYYEITPGVQGAGAASGPRPDQGTGYPRARDNRWRSLLEESFS